MLFFRERIGQSVHGSVMTLQAGQERNPLIPATDAAGALASVRASGSTALLLGFGNVLLGDDGAGVRLLERLQSELGPGVANFVDGGTLSFSLLPYMQGTESLVVIDAANLNATSGSIELFEGGEMDRFLATARRRTVHEIGLIDLLDMARLQDCLPARRALLCIQPARIDWSEALSTPVLRALPDAIRVARALLRRWDIL
jgi:hydrogenase maturation protease